MCGSEFTTQQIMLRSIKETFFCYLLCTSAHWFLTNIYAYLCTPSNAYGFFKTFMLLQTPYCQVLNSANNITFLTMQQTYKLTISWVLLRIANSKLYLTNNWNLA